MSYLNKVILIGNLGRDPELRHTQTGKAVCNFSIATSSKQGDKDVTEWHRIVAWDKQAESCAKYLRKGKTAYVEGRLQTKEYTNKEGVKMTSIEIMANQVLFLSPADKTAPAQEPQSSYQMPRDIPLDLDSIPF